MSVPGPYSGSVGDPKGPPPRKPASGHNPDAIAAAEQRGAARGVREAADWLDRFDGPGGRSSAYDKAGRDIIRLLRERASALESGGSR